MPFGDDSRSSTWFSALGSWRDWIEDEIAKLKRRPITDEDNWTLTIAENGTALPIRRTLNFGSGVTAVDNPTDARTDVTASGGGGDVTPIAWFNNSDGSMDGSRYQQFNQMATLGDTSWFQFPESGTDVTTIMVLEPGIVTVTCKAVGDGINPFEIEVEAGNDAVIAMASSPLGGVTCSGSAAFYDDEFGGFGDWPVIRVRTLGTATAVYTNLSVTFHAGAPTFSSH